MSLGESSIDEVCARVVCVKERVIGYVLVCDRVCVKVCDKVCVRVHTLSRQAFSYPFGPS